MKRIDAPIQLHDGAILAIQLGDIGDVVLTLPALRALKHAFPRNPLIACVHAKARELMDLCTDVDAVLAVDKKRRRLHAAIRYQLGFLGALRSRRYDLAIDFRTGTRGAFVSLLSGARSRLGFIDREGTLWRNRVFSHLVNREYRQGTHVADYYFELVRWLGVASAGADPVLPIPSELKQRVRALLGRCGIVEQTPFVVMQPFSLWAYKELHPDKYSALIDRIADRWSIPVVLCGAPSERDRAQAIAEQSRSPVTNLAGVTTIGELAGLLSLADYFIGIDSAGLHIAAAVGTPTAGIFGPSAPASWAPRGSRHTVIQNPLPCVPCRQKGCENSGISRCLEELTVDAIMAAIDPILDRRLQNRAAP